MTLVVCLNQLRLGVLDKLEDGSIVFRFDSGYSTLLDRPVLSQSFEDDLHARSGGIPPLLPPFFSNLLPESALRSFVLKQHRLDDRDEYGLIRVLGRDLPGAVVVTESGQLGELTVADQRTEQELSQEQLWSPTSARVRFSLGGQFLKFSAQTVGTRVVLPVSGVGGDALLKLPDRSFPALCELEWLVTEWARRFGIRVPNQRLVTDGDIDGVDLALVRTGPGKGRALCATRFDRKPQSADRVHYEDLAQVRGVYGDDTQKYSGDYAELAALVEVLCPDDLRELVRRLVFMVVSGNGDAHWKNWAVLYPDGRTPQLSPAYDLVSTVVYPSLVRETALTYMGVRDFRALDLTRLASIARVLSRDESELTAWVREDLAHALDVWRTMEPDLKLECELAFRIDDYHRAMDW